MSSARIISSIDTGSRSVDRLQHGLPGAERAAEIALQDVAEPAEIAHQIG